MDRMAVKIHRKAAGRCQQLAAQCPFSMFAGQKEAIDRDVASATAAALAVSAGANIVRTHNVAFTRDAVAVAAAVKRAANPNQVTISTDAAAQADALESH